MTGHEPKSVRIPEKYCHGLDFEKDDWAALKAYSRMVKDKSQKRRYKAVEEFNKFGEATLKASKGVSNYRRHTEWHASFTFFNLKHVDYYPSKRKAIYNGLTFTGGMMEILAQLFRLTAQDTVQKVEEVSPSSTSSESTPQPAPSYDLSTPPWEE